MIHYLFVKIPNLLFEPIAVGAFLGCIVALCIHRKKHCIFRWIITATIAFMLFWRLVLHSLMLSSRYVSILLYFAIILAVWFCFNLKPNNFARCRNRCFMLFCGRTTTYLLITGLVVASLIKTLKYDPYGDYSAKVSKSFSDEIVGKEYLVFSQGEPDRIAYYSGIDRKTIILLNNHNPPVNEQIKEIISRLKNFMDNLYFVLYLKQGEEEPNAEYLKVAPELGKWDCLHREYTSRQRNKECVLYRFIPTHPNIEIWEKDIPEITPENLCKNGDYEKTLSGKELEQRLAYYRKNHASDFYFAPERMFPVDWGLGIVNVANCDSSRISLTAEHPIDGVYSLELFSNNDSAWVINSCYIQKGNCIFSGFIRAKTEASIIIRSCYLDINTKDVHFINTYSFHLHPGKTYRFSFPINETDIPENDNTIFIAVQGTGHVLLDNIEAIRNNVLD